MQLFAGLESRGRLRLLGQPDNRVGLVRIFVNPHVIDEETLGKFSLRRIAAGLAAAAGENGVQRNATRRVVEGVERHRAVRAVVRFRRDELPVEVIRDFEGRPFAGHDIPIVDLAWQRGAVVPASQRAAGEYVQIVVEDAARCSPDDSDPCNSLRMSISPGRRGTDWTVRAKPERGPPTGLLAELDPAPRNSRVRRPRLVEAGVWSSSCPGSPSCRRFRAVRRGLSRSPSRSLG